MVYNVSDMTTARLAESPDWLWRHPDLWGGGWIRWNGCPEPFRDGQMWETMEHHVLDLMEWKRLRGRPVAADAADLNRRWVPTLHIVCMPHYCCDHGIWDQRTPEEIEAMRYSPFAYATPEEMIRMRQTAVDGFQSRTGRSHTDPVVYPDGTFIPYPSK